MPKRLKYELTEEELEAVHIAMKSSNAKEARRAQTLFALHLGKRPAEIAEMHAITPAPVYNTVKRFREEGVEGLRQKRQSGRPHALSMEQGQELERVLETDPQDLGYAFSSWTAKRLVTYWAEHWAIRVSETTLRDTLAHMGDVFRRAKKSLKYKQDPEAVEAFKSLLPELKKTPRTEPIASSLWIKRAST